jgi:hypothetical protein
MADFEITGCHANRAGQASVTLRDRATGALVSVHHMPFKHDYDESVGCECARIRAEAACFAGEAIAFLRSRLAETEVSPQPTTGAAPDHSEPPDAFGQPIGADSIG